ncbi:MAG TPA: Hsp20 family protein [Stellaceae bacterium]|nr:Hsp20 family protein [Stellaceae bacterium]
MNGFDFSPLFRSTIGFDRLTRLMDTANQLDTGASVYPPYNIEATGDNAYRLTMAVAGFGAADLEITAKEGALIVTAKAIKEEEGKQYLYRGIARRAFERRFQLADHIRVAGASLDNGLLHVDLVREVPEALKPRKIEIATGTQPQVLEQKAA